VTPEPTVSAPVEWTDWEAFQAAVEALDVQKPRQKGEMRNAHFRPFIKEARVEPKRAPEDCQVSEEMTRVRQEATVRARRTVLRREAVQRLQKWWRRVLYFRQFPPYFTLQKAVFRAACREITAQLRDVLTKSASIVIQSRKEVRNSYLHACAVIIQRKWRDFQHHKHVNTQNRRQKLLLALVQGWKTRKILQSWVLTGVKIRLKACKSDEKRLFVLELMQTFRDEYRCGKWMRTRKRPSKLPIPLPSSPSTSASTHTHHLSFLNETSSNSPSKSPASRRVRPGSPPKSFLRRKTKAVAVQKVCWAKVKTRVNCWGEGKKRPTASISPIYTRNSLEEFLVMEKITLQGENPLPSKRALSTSLISPVLHREKNDKNTGKVHEKAQIPGKSEDTGLVRLKLEAVESKLL